MLQDQATQEQVKVDLDNFEHGFPEGFGPGWWGHMAYVIGIAFAAFQIMVAAWNFLPSQAVRGIHVGFLILLSYGLVANFTAKTNWQRLLGWVTGGVGFYCGLYQWLYYADLIQRDGDPSHLDLVVGTVLAVMIFDATRRLMGWALPLMCGACIIYWAFGQYLPSPLNHRGYYFDQIITHLSYGTEGFYGVPIYVSATYIFLFILFGSFLERAGMIQLFTDVSLGIFGGTRGGPAKVAVVASGMMGTISGSGVANVVTVGQFTIPLMIRFGYRRAFAAGVEATASMGGQIMPPVMGAVAFIMAETIDRPYADIVQAAIIPALLYFGASYLSVHLESGKRGLKGLPGNELPNAWEETKKSWFLILPLVVLVVLLFTGYTPLFAGAVGLALTALLILAKPVAEESWNIPIKLGVLIIGTAVCAHALWTSGSFATGADGVFAPLQFLRESPVWRTIVEVLRTGLAIALFLFVLRGLSRANQRNDNAARIVYWIALGLLTAIALEREVVFALAIVVVVAIWSAFYARGRQALLECRDALADGARQALSVGLACAIVGIVVGTMTLTGLGTIVGTHVIGIGKDSLFLALVLTMLFSLLLGMGIPTIPNYIITSSLAAPILLKLGIPLIVSHMFVFYFGIMADLTPPVALAAFAAAPMARVSGFQVAYKAVLIALPGFIVPYMAVYDPSLMLQPVMDSAGNLVTGWPYWIGVAYITTKAVFAVLLWCVTAVGYLRGPVSILERAWTFVAAALLAAAIPLTDEIGWALGIAFVVYHYWKYMRTPAPQTKTA